MIKKRTITEDTLVTVVMKGEKGLYSIVDVNGGRLGSVVNTLSDLTGRHVEYVRTTLLEKLPTNYGVELATAAGTLCPIRFVVTVA